MTVAPELLKTLALQPRFAVLAVLLGLAAYIDIRTHRIPNLLILAGLSFAIPYNGLHPASAGANGWLVASAGCLVGFISLFPLYLLRTMGAGDVKLMAMVGAFVGPFGAFCSALGTFLAGGVLAITVLLCKRRMRRALSHVFQLLTTNLLTAPAASVDFTMSDANSTGKLPYAVAIAAGSLTYLAASGSGLIG